MFVLCAYGSAIPAPFIGDDYVFLDEVWGASFAELWSRSHTAFGWYRPWSRELHFWVLQGVAGAEPAAFRVASMLLWVGALVAYSAAVQRLADRRTAVLSTAGVAVTALWGAPLLWISGGQDLWMVLFVMLSLLAHVAGRRALAHVAYLGALLSKETAAVLPLLWVAYDVLVLRLRPLVVLRRAAPGLLLSVAWFFLHPTLLDRMLHPGAHTAGIQPRPALWIVMVSAVGTTLNANRSLSAFDPVAFKLWATLASTAALVLLVRAGGGRSATADLDRAPADVRRLVMFGAAWALVGWLPLFLPSIGWQSYYGCIGVCGAWLAYGALLSSRPRLAAALVLALGLVRGVSAASRSWDWGSEWYQQRAGNLLQVIQAQLRSHVPRMPPHSRIYFGSIPNNIGLIAGQSPAIRVWYRDPTLHAGFYSYYRRRASHEPDGVDRFFHFDSTRGLVEVRLGAEDIESSLRADPEWAKNHEALAITLLRGGSPDLAASEFEKISLLPERPDALMFAAIAWEAAGDLGRRDTLFTIAQRRLGGTRAQIDEWAGRLRGSLPTRYE